MEVETVGLGPIQEADGVIRIGNGPEHVMLLSAGIIGDDASLQLGKLVPTSANTDKNRGVLGLERAMKNLLYTAPAVLKGGPNGYGGAYAELLNYVAGLKHVGGPLIARGAAFEALDGEDSGRFWVSGG